MATWDDVRRLGLALPEVEEGTSWRQPALRVRGKWFAGLSSHEDGALVVRCDPDERPLMLETNPDVFWITPHYAGDSRHVLVRLESIDRNELAERVTDSWVAAAPKRLVAQLER